MRLPISTPITFVLILSLLSFAPHSVQACKDNPANASELDDGGMDRSVCPPVNCAPPPACAILNATPPFTRHSSTLIGPNRVGISCFAVARNANDYHLLFNSEAGNFRRSESTDGGVNWGDLGLVSGLTAPWMGGAQCPDPHFLGANGQMTMYFSATRTVAAGGSWTIARATSTDNGSSWTTDLAQLVQPTGTHFPYMPSGIPLPSGGWLLAYAWCCTGSNLAGATIDVLYSADGLNNWVPRAVPALTTGSCNTWDDGSVNRPRMVLDPLDDTGQTIYMFYSAYEWDGKVTRKCGRIGRAKSTDGGFTWVKATRPVFETAVGGTNWDDKQVLKPSLVFEPCPDNSANSFLRLFYEGANLISGGGLGIADAPWPFGSQICPTAQIALQEEPTPDDETIAKLTSVPNPTRGTTKIEVHLSRAQLAGEAELTIIDVTGRLVRQLWTGPSLTAPQMIDWDGRESSGARVAPGRYLARMRIGNMTAGTHWITMTR
jgi:hypothetical protein